MQRSGFPATLVFSQLPVCLDQAIKDGKAFYISFINNKTIINAEMMENVACCHVSVLYTLI